MQLPLIAGIDSIIAGARGKPKPKRVETPSRGGPGLSAAVTARVTLTENILKL
jgi:hypothetical protein